MQENGEEDKGKATPTQIHVDKKGVTCVYMHGVGFRERGGREMSRLRRLQICHCIGAPSQLLTALLAKKHKLELAKRVVDVLLTHCDDPCFKQQVGECNCGGKQPQKKGGSEKGKERKPNKAVWLLLCAVFYFLGVCKC